MNEISGNRDTIGTSLPPIYTTSERQRKERQSKPGSQWDMVGGRWTTPRCPFWVLRRRLSYERVEPGRYLRFFGEDCGHLLRKPKVKAFLLLHPPARTYLLKRPTGHPIAHHMRQPRNYKPGHPFCEISHTVFF